MGYKPKNGSHTLYLNPDRDTSKTDRAGVKDLDHHFGVMLEAKFVLPADGKDENGNPIRFDFSGDDDMWVFIDDELVLDIGGIHQPVSGTIDFQNGKAYVVGDHTVAGHSDNTGTNAVATAYGAGVTRNSTGDGNYYFYNDDSVGKKIQLGDGKVHTMKIFYIERGGCDSNCEITFNLPTVKTGNLDLKKVWGDVERQAEEVYYTITANYKEASDANKRDLAKFFSTMTEKELTQYGLTKDNIKQIDANNDGVLDSNDPYVFVVKGSDWELKLKQLRICQDSLQNGNLTHDQEPLTYTVLERYALVGGKIVDAADQYSQAVEKSGAPLPSTSNIVLGENDVSLWQDTTGNNASFNVTNRPGMNVTVNKEWGQDCEPLSDTTITGVVKRYKLVDKGNTLTIQSVLEDPDNSGIDFSGVTYAVMKNGQQVGDLISFADAQAGKTVELPDSGPYTVVENNVPGTPQGYSVVHDPQNQQHNVTLDPNGNTTVTFTNTYKQANKPSNSTYLVRDYYYYNYQGGKDLNSGNIEFPVGARVTMKFKCKNGNWSSRDMKAEYNGETVSITASKTDYNWGNPQNLEFTVGPFTVVENGQLVVDVNTNGNSNNDGFVSGSVTFTQVRSLHGNLRAMRMPLKAVLQKTDLTFSQDLNETTLASLPAAPEGKHYILDEWSKEVILDDASDWTKTVAVDVGNNYGDYYYFLASVTEHNVTPDTQGTIATNNDGSIRFAHKHADSNLPFKIENKLVKGSLKISKTITENGSGDNVSDTVKSRLAGTYTFTIYKNEECTVPYEEVSGTPKTVTITIGADGATAYSEEVTGLRMGDYWIKETLPTNDSIPVTNPVKVTVTPGATGNASPIAAFTNNYETTNISVTKAWSDAETVDHSNDTITFTLYQVAINTSGETVKEEAYSGSYTNTIQGSGTVRIEELPRTGILNGVPVTYSYYISECEGKAGYTQVIEHDGNSNQWTIKNISPDGNDKPTSISVTKVWKDSADHVTTDAHTDDTITFKLIQRAVDCNYVPVTLKLFDAHGNLNETKLYYIQKGGSFTLTTRRESTLLISHGIVVTTDRSNNDRATWDATSEETHDFVFTDISKAMTVSAQLTYGRYLLLLYDRWVSGSNPNNVHSWVHSETGTGIKSNIDDVVTAAANNETAATQEHLFTLKKDSLTDGSFTKSAEGWVGTISDLPLYKKIQDGLYYTYYYTIDEISVNGETVTGKTTTGGVTTGQTSEYLVTVDQDARTITNKERETVNVDAKKAWINPDLTTNAPDGAKVTFELFADNAATGKTVELDGKTLTEEIEAIRADDSKTEEEKTTAIEALESTLYGEFTAWKAEWRSLPKYSDEVNKIPINYIVKETSGFGVYENKNPEGVESGGTITNELKTFKLDILKVDKKDHNKKLKDAEFTLRKMASDVIPENDIKYADNTVYGTATTDKDGKASFEDIIYGFYEVKETIAPVGYVFDDEHAFYIKVSSEGVQLIEKDLAAAPENWEVVETYGDVFSFTYGTQTNTASASVENTPGAALPNTGGPGTSLHYLLGIMLTAFAGAGLVMRRRRRGDYA